MKKIFLPHLEEQINSLHAGDPVLLSGVIYTARDHAHKRIFELLDKDMVPPFSLKGSVIYYAGPCPAPEGMTCGSCGPTTSARMNVYAPRLLDLGVKGLIGKGELGGETVEAVKRNGAVYFAAIGGAGALYGNAVKRCECVAFPDLLSEAVYRMEISDFPVLVALTPRGDSIFKTER